MSNDLHTPLCFSFQNDIVSIIYKRTVRQEYYIIYHSHARRPNMHSIIQLQRNRIALRCSRFFGYARIYHQIIAPKFARYFWGTRLKRARRRDDCGNVCSSCARSGCAISWNFKYVQNVIINAPDEATPERQMNGKIVYGPLCLHSIKTVLCGTVQHKKEHIFAFYNWKLMKPR